MGNKATILIVEDKKTNVDILVEAFADEYKIMVALDGEKALKAVQNKLPDLILLDIIMKDLNGYQVCQKLKSDPRTSDIPVIFVTAMDQEANEKKGLDVGGIDYITKPFNMPIVKARVKNHLELKNTKEKLKNKNHDLEQEVKGRTRMLELTQDVAIQSLAYLAETRDNETGEHLIRTRKYVKLLAEFLKDHQRFSDYLTEENIEWIYKTAPLHDIGKVGIPDRILYKKGKLNQEEFAVIKKHTCYGREAIEKAEQNLGSNSFLKFARQIVGSHHEKWDGSGYPEGLKKEEIPIAARLMAVADVYDALVNKRVYKPAYNHQKAVKIITQGDGRTLPEHFDPAVLDAFVHLQDKFKKIAAASSNKSE